jgi:hypothetical protein
MTLLYNCQEIIPNSLSLNLLIFTRSCLYGWNMITIFKRWKTTIMFIFITVRGMRVTTIACFDCSTMMIHLNILFFLNTTKKCSSWIKTTDSKYWKDNKERKYSFHLSYFSQEIFKRNIISLFLKVNFLLIPTQTSI